MTKSNSPRIEKMDFFEKNFSEDNDSLIVVGVNNSSRKCYLEEDLSLAFKDDFFEMPFKNSHFNQSYEGNTLSITDLGLKGHLFVSEDKILNFHLPWKNVVYIASVVDGCEPKIKKW